MNTINNYLKKYAYFIFLFLTFFIMILRIPFWDETHSLEIAMCSFKEIFHLLRIEMHPILWFLILKPFSNIKLYPYAMYLINWLFCAGSIYLLIKKAHFSYIAKTLIAFSTPFFLYFAPVSRCYAIGIFLLFLICTYYPVRFKKPYLFSSLIVLASQTSIMTMVGAFYIGLIYLFELVFRYKKKLFSKKELCLIFLIFLCASIFTIAEFIGYKGHDDVLVLQAIQSIFDFVVFPHAKNTLSLLLRISFMVLFYLVPYFLFKYSKKGLFFIFFTYLTLTLIFTFANIGNYWNHYFYFIYAILLFWIFGKKLLKIKFIKYACIINLVFMLFPCAVNNGKITYVYSSKSKAIAQYIINNNELKNTKLYTLEWWSDISPGADIYLKKNNIKIYNKNNIERGSFEDLRTIFEQRYELIDFDDFIKYTPKKFYILASNDILKQRYKNCLIEKKENRDLIITTINNKYHLECIECKPDLKFAVYKVIKL